MSHYQVATAFLAVGDLNSYSLLCSRLLASIEHLRGWTWGQTNNLVCIYALGLDALADMSTPVRLAEATLKSLNTEESEREAVLLKTLRVEEASTFEKRTEPGRRASRAAVLGTLCAALFLGGRFEDAIHRLDEGIRLRKGESDRVDWAFLAMAHYRLGHNDEARHWIDRFRDDHPNLGDETNEYILANLSFFAARPRRWFSTTRSSRRIPSSRDIRETFTWPTPARSASQGRRRAAGPLTTTGGPGKRSSRSSRRLLTRLMSVLLPLETSTHSTAFSQRASPITSARSNSTTAVHESAAP